MVELLMVIAIIGMLMALIFPALNSFRESGRRTQCLTQMKSVADAIDVYANIQNEYPGWRNPPLKSGGPNASWVVPLLTEFSRNDVYEEWRTSNSPAAPKIDLLICPTDTTKYREGMTNPMISFVVNAGRPDRDPDTSAGELFRDYRSNGLFLDRVREPDNKMTPAFVAKADGKANVLMLSENLDATRWNATSGEEDSCMLWRSSPSAIHHINGTGSGSGIDLARPSSGHEGGVNSVLANGSARFLNQDINYNTYKDLLTVRSESVLP